MTVMQYVYHYKSLTYNDWVLPERIAALSYAGSPSKKKFGKAKTISKQLSNIQRFKTINTFNSMSNGSYIKQMKMYMYIYIYIECLFSIQILVSYLSKHAIYSHIMLLQYETI